MEYALSNPDDIRKAGKTKVYSYMRDGRNRTVDAVLYEKSIGKKSYYVVQAVPDTKAKSLYVVAAFIGKAGYKKEASQLINVEHLDATSKNGSASTSANSITHPDDSVNSQFSISDENVSKDATEAPETAPDTNAGDKGYLTRGEPYGTAITGSSFRQTRRREDFFAQISPNPLQFSKKLCMI